MTGERRRKAFKSEGFGEIDEITYTDERIEQESWALKVAACIKFHQWEAAVRYFIRRR